jgi:superfamily II DNA or RNA helicase
VEASSLQADDVLPGRLPEVGELVQARSRRWLVEEILAPAGASPIVRLACAEDDAQGEPLEVFWRYELDRAILDEEGWTELAKRGFDEPRYFAAYLHTLRWSAVTATDPDLFQAPFRAGIEIDAYQMEPLRKALRMPRVNLFIADDTGLGKTIEAGLIARELLLRKKAKTIVVAAPPSVLEQWKAELDERFGLVFEVLDRHYVARVRRQRGFGVNPWRTHSRFLVSHNLLADPTYADPLREWLGDLLPGSLLILDEAHHAAPSSGGRYGIETKLTRAVRDLGGRFEHRLFLSATPHNGHSNSFSTLLELLDPYRFTRGVRVDGRRALEDVMVRRLKEDLRALQGGFPERVVKREAIEDLRPDAPELELSRLLDEYRTAREERFANASSRTQAAAGLLVVGLQQRLLSSIEAFARSLQVHRRTVERQRKQRDEAVQALQQEAGAAAQGGERDTERQAELLAACPGPDDEGSEWATEELRALELEDRELEGRELETELEADEIARIEAVTAATESAAPQAEANTALWRRELELLERMEQIAERSRHLPDAKVLRLLDWVREHLCPELPPFGQRPQGPPPAWLDGRVLIFTENREGTKRYLQETFERAIADTDRAEERIAVITGLTSGARRQEIQRRFNTDPADDPLRILIATDAAREGLNFQAHCTDLFHFDLPWNPGRIEQRNGRIDRKLQPAPEVRCHYFVLPQRTEDRVLEVLVGKTERIKRELGSLSKVIDDQIEQRMRGGIRHRDADRLAAELERADLDAEHRRVAGEELEAARERQDDLRVQVDRCRKLLEGSRRWVGFGAKPFRAALSCSLELLGAEPLREGADEHGRQIWRFPSLDARAASDPSWAATLDTLRAPRAGGQKLADWRHEAPVRPVVFEDQGVLSDATVHLHLEQRVAQRLLGRFRAQGFIHNDLSRACVAHAADSIPRVLLLGRLALYGRGAERLHEELVPVAARWVEPSRRDGPLTAYAREAEAVSVGLLEDALAACSARRPSAAIVEQLLEAAPGDVAELLPQLQQRAEQLAGVAAGRLSARGTRESADLRRTLERQRERVDGELRRRTDELPQLTLDYDQEERRQLESDMRSWGRRLEQFDRELETEPQRVERFYEVRARRIEPVGLVYLWPDTN